MTLPLKARVIADDYTDIAELKALRGMDAPHLFDRPLADGVGGITGKVPLHREVADDDVIDLLISLKPTSQQ